jgi:hypothetical protein
VLIINLRNNGESSTSALANQDQNSRDTQLFGVDANDLEWCRNYEEMINTQLNYQDAPLAEGSEQQGEDSPNHSDSSDSDSTEAREVTHHPRNDSESECEIIAYGQHNHQPPQRSQPIKHPRKQPMKQPLKRLSKRGKGKANQSNCLNSSERRVRHWRSARQIAKGKYAAELEKWNKKRAIWARKAENRGKQYSVPMPELPPARRVNRDCKLVCSLPTLESFTYYVTKKCYPSK